MDTPRKHSNMVIIIVNYLTFKITKITRSTRVTDCLGVLQTSVPMIHIQCNPEQRTPPRVSDSPNFDVTPCLSLVLSQLCHD